MVAAEAEEHRAGGTVLAQLVQADRNDRDLPVVEVVAGGFVKDDLGEGAAAVILRQGGVALDVSGNGAGVSGELEGDLLGRLRPWQRLGDRAADQVRFTGVRARGGAGRQTVVVLAHAVTAPRTS
ncbi:hypothetical protein GCM10010415_65140 [Streptomyces atrovirens]|uniref:Uncharacterized protein n=1 Tax=Streptomyces atrovirens TaxID=285556 RepID=A0ABW0DQ88_9ACTN